MTQTDASRIASEVQSANLRGAGIMVLAMSAFTLGDTCMKLVSEQIPLYQAIALRGVVSMPLLVLLGFTMGGLHLRRIAASWRIVSLRTFAEVGATVTFFYALLHLPLAITTAIMQSAPLGVTAGAALFLGEKVGWRRALAVCVGFLGVLIIVRPGPEGLNPYAFIALLSVGFVVLRDLTTRQMPKNLPSIGVALCAAVMVNMLALVLTPPWEWEPVPLSVLPPLLLAAFLVTAGYILSINVMRVGEISFTTPFRYSALLWAMLMSWLFWGFFPDALTLVGVAIVVASGLFTLWREARSRKQPQGL